MLVHNDSVTLIDFDFAKFVHEDDGNSEMEREMASLEQQLAQKTGRGGVSEGGVEIEETWEDWIEESK